MFESLMLKVADSKDIEKKKNKEKKQMSKVPWCKIKFYTSASSKTPEGVPSMTSHKELLKNSQIQMISSICQYFRSKVKIYQTSISQMYQFSTP